MHFVCFFAGACLSNLFYFVFEQGWGVGLEKREKSVLECGKEREVARL